MKKTKIQMVEISRLQLNRGQIKWLPRNPRQWTQADIDKMTRSLERDPDFVEERPVLATPGKGDALVVFAHNLLTESASRAGHAALPAVIYTPENEDDRETIRRRALLDNGAMGRNDTDILANEWPYTAEELVDFGYADYTGETEKPAPATAQAQEDDFDEDADAVETRCKPGDIWELGAHRLMCGDSTDAAQVALLMNGEKADLLLTDPPYGISADKMTMGMGKQNYTRGEWDSTRPDLRPLLDIAPLVCIWGGNYFADMLPVNNDWLCWYKNNDGRSFSEFELAWTNYGRNCRHITHHWGSEKKLHITMKPVEVIAWAIQQPKTECKNIVDLFGGSGTTLIAAEQLGRRCYTMEIDPHFCDVILARWEKLTGQTARKLE